MQLLRRRDPLHAPLCQQCAQRGRFNWLVEQLGAVRAGLFAHMRAPIGCNQDGCEIGTEAATQLVDGGYTVAVVEVVIYQETVRRYFGFCGDRYGGREIRRLEDPAAPAPEQRFHAVEYRQVIVDAQNGDARKLHAVDITSHALMQSHRNGR